MPDIRDTLGIEDVEHVPSTVNQYSKGIGSTDVAQEQMDEKGANWAAVLGNQARLVPEYFTEIAPIARSVSPIGLFTGAENWSDWWEGQKYIGPVDLARSIKNTKLEMDEDKGTSGFIKISKSQDDETFGNVMAAFIRGNTINDDDIFGMAVDLAKEQGHNIESKADAEKLFNEDENFNQFVNDIVNYVGEENENKMIYGRDWFQDDNNYYIKNFKERPGVNFAWTQYDDLSIPGHGIYKVDEDGKGSMLSASPLSYKGIPGMEQLQEAGYWGLDPEAMAETETGQFMYNMMFDKENESTQLASQLLALPASLATGNIKNIMHLPQAAKNLSALKALKTPATRSTWGTKAPILQLGDTGEGVKLGSRTPGMVEEGLKSAVGWPMAKGAWQHKGKVGIASMLPLWGAYGPDWP